MPTFTSEELYAPCFCGSGKKLKFCCKDKKSREPNTVEIGQLEKALDALDAGEIDTARPLLEKLLAGGVGTVEVRLGLIQVLVSDGDYAAALTAGREAWGIPGRGRDAAGAVLAQLLCLHGDLAEANGLVDEILSRRSAEPVVVMEVLRALNLLERDADIVAWCKSAVVAAVPLAPHTLAVAQVNVGERTKGLAGLRAAAWDDPDTRGLITLLASSSSSSTAWPWPRFEAVPADVFLPAAGGIPYAEQAATGALVDDEDASRIVARGLRSGLLVRDQPRYVHGVLGFIAALHPTVATSTLRAVWESAWSTDALRLSAARQAVAFGLIPDGSTCSLVVDGVRSDVVVHAVDERGHDVRAAIGLDGVDERALAKARFLLRAGRSKQAAAAFDALLAAHPDSAFLQHQVASQRLMQRAITDDEFIAETQALVTRVPRLLEARQALARLLEVIGRVDEASALLDDSHLIDAPDEEVACFTHMVLARLALHSADSAAVKRHVDGAAAWLGLDLLRAIEPQIARAAYPDA